MNMQLTMGAAGPTNSLVGATIARDDLKVGELRASLREREHAFQSSKQLVELGLHASALYARSSAVVPVCYFSCYALFERIPYVHALSVHLKRRFSLLSSPTLTYYLGRNEMISHPESKALRPLATSIRGDSDAWPQFVLRGVNVMSQRTGEAISLLSAHEGNKVTVTGKLGKVDRDMAHLRTTPRHLHSPHSQPTFSPASTRHRPANPFIYPVLACASLADPQSLSAQAELCLTDDRDQRRGDVLILAVRRRFVRVLGCGAGWLVRDPQRGACLRRRLSRHGRGHVHVLLPRRPLRQRRPREGPGEVRRGPDAAGKQAGTACCTVS